MIPSSNIIHWFFLLWSSPRFLKFSWAGHQPITILGISHKSTCKMPNETRRPESTLHDCIEAEARPECSWYSFLVPDLIHNCLTLFHYVGLLPLPGATWNWLVGATLPFSSRERYPTTVAIIDASEVFIQTPSDLMLQSTAWSNYKHHNAMMFW